MDVTSTTSFFEIVYKILYCITFSRIVKKRKTLFSQMTRKIPVIVISGVYSPVGMVSGVWPRGYGPGGMVPWGYGAWWEDSIPPPCGQRRL